jgi:hypothetical protein
VAATAVGRWRYGGGLGRVLERVMNEHAITATQCCRIELAKYGLIDYEKRNPIHDAIAWINKMAALEYEIEQRQSHEEPTPEEMRQDYEDAN